MSSDWLLMSWSTLSLHICAYFTCSVPARRSILWQRQCFFLLLLPCLCVHVCSYTLSNKESVSHFWTAITVPLRKLSRWVWNMQQFVWSLRSPFRAAFACNYKRISSVPCNWRILFMLRSNFLFLGEWEKAASCFFSLNVQPTLLYSTQKSLKPRGAAPRLLKLQKLENCWILFIYLCLR